MLEIKTTISCSDTVIRSQSYLQKIGNKKEIEIFVTVIIFQIKPTRPKEFDIFAKELPSNQMPMIAAVHN